MGKRADKLLENLLKAHDQGALAELTKKMAGGFPPLVDPSPPILNIPPAITTTSSESAITPSHDSGQSVMVTLDTAIAPIMQPVSEPATKPAILPNKQPFYSTVLRPDNTPVSEPGNEPDIYSVDKPDSELDNICLSAENSIKHSLIEPVICPDKEPVLCPVHNPDLIPERNPVIMPDISSVYELAELTVRDEPQGVALLNGAAYEPVQKSVHGEYTNTDAISKPDNKPELHVHSEPTKGIVCQPDHELVYSPVKCIDPELWYPFTEKQGKVLFYLIDAGGLANRQHISDDTGVNIATVKHTLRILVKEGYIGQIRLYVNHTQRGFSYRINPELCNEYYGRLKGWQECYPARYPVYREAKNPNIEPVYDPDSWPDNLKTIGPAKKPVNSPVTMQEKPLRGRSEPQATTDQTSTTESIILTTPEMAYWLDLGLQDSQVRKWCADFEITPTEIRQQLAWARWDLVMNGREADIEKDAIEWFLGTLRKTAGCYPPAKGYLTPIEIRANWSREQLAAEDKAHTVLSEMEHLTAREVEG